MRDNSVAIYIYIYRCGHIVYNCYLSLSYLLVVAQPKDNNIIIFVVLHVVNHDVKIIRVTDCFFPFNCLGKFVQTKEVTIIEWEREGLYIVVQVFNQLSVEIRECMDYFSKEKSRVIINFITKGCTRTSLWPSDTMTTKYIVPKKNMRDHYFPQLL